MNLYAVKFANSPLWLRKNWLRLAPAQQLTDDVDVVAPFQTFEGAKAEADRFGGIVARHPSTDRQPEFFSLL